MTSNKKFTYHDKRVTLHLAMLSACCREIANLGEALDLLPGVGWDVYALPQKAQEVIFAEFDESLEEKIKAEFIADPAYLIDLGHAMGTCPLCGHVGCRYIFRIANTANGKTVECGSECIVTHGLCVKGAETAEHARKALQVTISRHIKKLKIEAWHTESGFSGADFEELRSKLLDIYKSNEPYKTRASARCKAIYDLPKLEKFYSRNGWLNTKKRWDEWRRLAWFARKWGTYSKTWRGFEELNPKKATASKKAGGEVDLPESAPVVDLTKTFDEPTVEEIVKAEGEAESSAMASEFDAEMAILQAECEANGLPTDLPTDLPPAPIPDSPWNAMVKEMVIK